MSGDILKRKHTRRIYVGKVPVGETAPISVQSMTNTSPTDVIATLGQIRDLAEAGCEIVRVAVPDDDAVEAFKEVRAQSPIPVIADIHFDYRLALRAIGAGADAVRINPGNIGGTEKFASVIKSAKEAGICIRVGVNAGSLDKQVLKSYGSPTPEAMVRSALMYTDFMKSMGFQQYKVSLKSSDVLATVAAYRLFSEMSDAPLHVGVTEAGPLVQGTVKSALGIGLLLYEGIGDTIRVSLSASPVHEVRAAYAILRTLRIRERGVEIISCPTCGRCHIDLLSTVEKVEEMLAPVTRPLKVAVMGCVVNGPGEAREADVGVAGGQGQGVLFKKGKLIRKLREEEIVRVLIEEVKKMADL
jgi:(E)-4-hydroxy-3-methylbut-2-enyl-diphosphate synthase